MLSSRRMAYIGAVSRRRSDRVRFAVADTASAGRHRRRGVAAGHPSRRIECRRRVCAAPPMAAEADSASADSEDDGRSDHTTCTTESPSTSPRRRRRGTSTRRHRPPTSRSLRSAAALGVEGDVRQLAADLGGGWMVGPDDYSHADPECRQRCACKLVVQPGQRRDAVDRHRASCIRQATRPGTSATPPRAPRATRSAPTPRPAKPLPQTLHLCPPTAPRRQPRCPCAPSRLLRPTCPTAPQPSQGPTSCSSRSVSTPTRTSTRPTPTSGAPTSPRYLVLDGIRTTMALSVGFGAEGALTWASGFLATPLRGADYPRIGIEAAVQRLNDQSSSWMGLETDVARGAVDRRGRVPATVRPPARSSPDTALSRRHGGHARSLTPA